MQELQGQLAAIQMASSHTLAATEPAGRGPGWDDHPALARRAYPWKKCGVKRRLWGAVCQVEEFKR